MTEAEQSQRSQVLQGKTKETHTKRNIMDGTYAAQEIVNGNQT